MSKNSKTKKYGKKRINKFSNKYKTNYSPLYSYNLNENEIIEKELDIVNDNIDKLMDVTVRSEVNSSLVKNIISIVEDFLRSNKLICYGGTAINNILPLEDRFYDYSKEVPDYDFFSKNALRDAKRLADIYIEKGFTEVEAKSGIHIGTYKLFVNFIPVADITQLSSNIFDNLFKNSLDIFGISYAPPDYLRMSMYLELSRPRGDVARWEKVAKRLSLLNKSFPMKVSQDCFKSDFSKAVACSGGECKLNENKRIITLQHLIGLGLVFFGGYASSLYSKYMTNEKKQLLKDIPYYDIISSDAKKDTMLLKVKLKYDGFENIKIKKHASKSENIPEHFELLIDNKPVAFVYQALACHNYNVIRIDNTNIHIATIDTMLNMYLIFIYSNEKHLNNNRIMCMASFIFDLHQKNRLNQKGIFRRFGLPCIGIQETLMDIRRKRSEKYEELKKENIKESEKEFEKHFLRYIPSKTKQAKKTIKNIKKRKNKTRRK